MRWLYRVMSYDCKRPVRPLLIAAKVILLLHPAKIKGINFILHFSGAYSVHVSSAGRSNTVIFKLIFCLERLRNII